MHPPGLDAMHYRCPRSPRQSYGSETGYIAVAESAIVIMGWAESKGYSRYGRRARGSDCPSTKRRKRWHQGKPRPHLDERVGTRPWLEAARTVEHARSGYLMLVRSAFKSAANCLALNCFG